MPPSQQSPGYYPDPASGNQIRYWDGSRWAEGHQSSSTPYGNYGAAPTTGSADAAANPYADIVSSAERSAYEQPAYGQEAYGQPTYGQQQPSWGTPPQPGYGAQPPAYQHGAGYGAPFMVTSRPGSARRRGIAAAIAVVALIVVAGGIVAAVRNAGRPPEPVGAVEVDVPLEGDVPSDDSWPTALTISDAGVYILTATSDEDLTLALYDTTHLLIENDDGRLSLLNSSSLDPMVAVYLEPGDYVVDVDTYSDRDSASATLSVQSRSDAVEVALDTETPLTVPAEGAWVGYAALGDASGVGIDVRADDPSEDLLLWATNGDDVEDNDDRGSSGPPAGQYDPYVELRGGDYVVMMVGPWGGGYHDPVDATVTVTAR